MGKTDLYCLSCPLIVIFFRRRKIKMECVCVVVGGCGIVDDVNTEPRSYREKIQLSLVSLPLLEENQNTFSS